MIEKATHEAQEMKRIGNIYHKIISLENLRLADAKARKGKRNQPGVVSHDRNREANILRLHQMLKDRTYTTSEYTTFSVFEPKERLVYRLPYYPDRIVHHAIMNILEPIFVATFTADTYSCIKGKGIHAASRALSMALQDREATRYCLKLDIKKFYPSIDHNILKALLRRKFKDSDLLWLLDNIIDSAEGVPIGNYLSQYFANFFLSYFDHWIKEDRKVKNYFRYADDIVIPAASKSELHQLLADIRGYLATHLKLTIKSNYQIFPVDKRPIDFVGYVHHHDHIRLRKTIKKNFARKMAYERNPASIASYRGWASHASSNHLLKKLLNETERIKAIQ